MSRPSLAVCVLVAFSSLAGVHVKPLHAQILLDISSLEMKGDSQIDGYQGWITLGSFDFSVEREMAESGEKGGTEDINIGVGEINEFTMTKRTSAVSPSLFQFAINGNSLGTADVVVLTGDGANGLVPFAIWRFDRVFVKDYAVGSSGGLLSESFSFYFNRIAYAVADGRGGFNIEGWDRVTNKRWENHGLPGDIKISPVSSSAKGDFNFDGMVDAADYTVWRDGLDTTYDESDYTLWRNHFGAATDATATTAVPEPGALALAALALLLCPVGARGHAAVNAST